MFRFLKISTLVGAGFVVGVLGLARALREGALVISENGNIRVETTPIEYAKNGLKTIKNISKDEE